MNQFPNNQQAIDSNDCGPTCLINIYEYFGKKIKADEVRNSLDGKSNNFSFPAQMALQLHSNNLDVVLLSSNSQLITPEWSNASSEEIAKLITKRINLKNQNWSISAQYLVDYLREGGKLEILSISTKIIDHLLNDDYILLMCVDESWIWGRRKLDKFAIFDSVKGKTNGHFVVVYGVEGDNYLISDPYPTKIQGRDGYYSVGKEELLVSSLIWDPEVVAVKAK